MATSLTWKGQHGPIVRLTKQTVPSRLCAARRGGRYSQEKAHDTPWQELQKRNIPLAWSSNLGRRKSSTTREIPDRCVSGATGARASASALSLCFQLSLPRRKRGREPSPAALVPEPLPVGATTTTQPATLWVAE